jgi:IS5 family transposase
MKMHVGVDVISGLTQTAVGTAANVSDVAMAGQLLRSDDKIVFADAGSTRVPRSDPRMKARTSIGRLPVSVAR